MKPTTEAGSEISIHRIYNERGWIMGFAGFMGDIEEEQEREREISNLQRIAMLAKSPQTHQPHTYAPSPSDIVSVCEKCGMALTMSNYWKIDGKNLCEKHGKAYAEYLKS